jgi:hypothetical protein
MYEMEKRFLGNCSNIKLQHCPKICRKVEKHSSSRIKFFIIYQRKKFKVWTFSLNVMRSSCDRMNAFLHTPIFWTVYFPFVKSQSFFSNLAYNAFVHLPATVLCIKAKWICIILTTWYIIILKLYLKIKSFVIII